MSTIIEEDINYDESYEGYGVIDDYEEDSADENPSQDRYSLDELRDLGIDKTTNEDS